MKYWRNLLFCAAAAFLSDAGLFAALPTIDVVKGAVPIAINYQGRLEKNGAPVSENVTMSFKVYDGPSTGTATCLWGPLESGSCLCNSCDNNTAQTVVVSKGIYGVMLAMPADIFVSSTTKYLQTVVNGEALAPIQPVNSGAFAFVSKKLEPGSNLQSGTLTVPYDVYLATAGGNVGVRNIAPAYRLDVVGDIKVTGNFSINGSRLNALGQGSAPSLVATQDGYIRADTDTLSGGDIIMMTSNVERLRIAGGTDSVAQVTIAGDFVNTANNFGILPFRGVLVRPVSSSYPDALMRLYPKNTSENPSRFELYSQTSVDLSNTDDDSNNYTRGVLVMSSSGLRIGSERGSGGGSIRPLEFATGGIIRISISNSGAMSASSDLRGNLGVRSDGISLGSYWSSGWSLPAGNEISAVPGSPLVIGYTNPANVGISVASPTQKLHVGGNIVAENALIAGAGVTLSSNVVVNGNFSSTGGAVTLSSMTVYGNMRITGSLEVDDGIGTDLKYPVYLKSTQTFSGVNTFANIFGTHDKGMTVGYSAFPSWLPAKYLHVIGQNSSDDARLNIAAGSGAGYAAETAVPELEFYRSTLNSAGISVDTGKMSIKEDDLLRVFLQDAGDQTYYPAAGQLFAVHNGGLSVSTAASAATPALLINSVSGAIGLSTATLTFADSHPAPSLVVPGDIKFTSSALGLVFGNGSTITSASSGGGPYSYVSSPGDAIISAGGKVLLKTRGNLGLVVKNTGSAAYVGIRTQDPTELLHVVDGNMWVGGTTAFSPSFSGANNLIVEGDVFVNRDVRLSQLSGSRVGIGTQSPQATLDVNGAISLQGLQMIGADRSFDNITNVTLATGRLTDTMANSETLRLSGAAAGIKFSGTSPVISAGTANLALMSTLVGVNVSPSYGLDVGGSGAVSGQAVFGGNLTVSGSAFSVGTTGLVLSGGNVSIGKASASAKLDAAGAVTWGSDTSFSNRSKIAEDGTLTLITPLVMSSGGTGLVSLTANSVLYYNGSDVVGLAAPSANAVLRRSGAALGFGTMDLSSSGAVGTSVLRVKNGGTGIASPTAGGILFASDANTVAVAVPNSQYNVLISGGSSSDPAFASVNMASASSVSGILPIANGGTNNDNSDSSLGTGNFLIFNGTKIVASSSNEGNMGRVGSSAPSSPSMGELFYNTSNNTLCVYTGSWHCI